MWFRQLPFLTLLVFAIGIGLGFAWRTGFIPLELSSANTGKLSEEDIARQREEIPLSIVEAENRVKTTDPEVFAAQSEPASVAPTRRTTAPVSNVRPRPVEPAAPLPTERTSNDEPAWARSAEIRTAEVLTESTSEPRRGPAKVPSKEIRLVANQEPPSGSNDALPKELAPSSLAETLRTVDEQIANKEYLAAHRTLSKLYWNQKQDRGEVLPRLEVTARAIFFEPKPDLIEPYVVQPNEQLRGIASKYQLSWEYLSKLNRVDPRRLQLNQKLKVLKGPFSAVVDLNDFALTVHLQGYFVKRYTVGIGKDEASPIGKFPVLNKIENPEYTGPDGKVIAADDPKNPLGERWIDLGDSYGIHGTIEPDSIGKAASRGCIRMRANDVIEVYNFLVKGSEVLIRK